MVDFGTVLPVAHEQLSVLVAPETDILPYLLDLLHLLDFLLFLLDVVLSGNAFSSLLGHIFGLLTDEARTVFGTTQTDLEEEIA